MSTLLGHGGSLVFLDQALKVALIVGWVLACGVGSLLLAGAAGVVLRNLLRLRWSLTLLLPALNVGVLVLLVRTFATEKSLLPDFAQLLFGVPVVAIVGLAAGVLVALPPRMSDAAPAGSPGAAADYDDDDLLRPREPGRGAAALIREGMAAPLAGWQVMRRHPTLWRYAVIPVVLNLLITLLILIGLASLAVFFATRMHPLFQPTWRDRLLEAGAILLLIVAAIGGTIAAWVLLNGILCGHFFGRLAGAVEVRVGAPPGEMRKLKFRHEVVDAVRDLAAVIGINLGVLALNLVPVLGTVVAFPLGAYFNFLLLGRDFVNFPLALRGLRRHEKNSVVRRHRWETVGLGGAVFLFQLIPILGAVVSATAVAGAVVLHRRWSPAPVPGPQVAHEQSERQ